WYLSNNWYSSFSSISFYWPFNDTTEREVDLSQWAMKIILMKIILWQNSRQEDDYRAVLMDGRPDFFKCRAELVPYGLARNVQPGGNLVIGEAFLPAQPEYFPHFGG